ncbi:MAG: hypothetical protein ACJ8GN_26510 [Longimicrobiaceae bacterium]
MRTPKSWRAALAGLAVATGVAGVVAVPRGNAQTAYPSVWGISNMGETCSGWCYGGQYQYICCKVVKQPAPPAE